MAKFYLEKFKKIRMQKYKDMVSFAESMGISRRSIWVWETGKNSPSEKSIRLLAKKMGISVSEISDLTDQFPTSAEKMPIVEKQWKNFAGEDEFLKDDKIVEVLYTINRYRNELKRSSVIINALLSSMKVILYIKDIDLKYMVANNSFLKNVSMPVNMLVLGKDDKFFFSKADAKINTEQDQQILNTGKPLIKHEGYIPGSRNKKWGLISKIPIFDSKGNISGLVGTFVDISERKIAERTRQLLDVNVKAMHEALGLYDFEKDKFIYLNEAVEKIIGYKAEDFYKKGNDFWVNTCIHPDDRKRHMKLTFNAPEKYSEELRIIKPDGQTRWISIAYSNTEIGGKKCLLAISRDITDKKKAGEIKELLELNLNASIDGVGLYSLTGNKYLYLNKAVEEISGYKLEYFYKGQHDFWLNNCVHPDDRKKQKKRILDLSKGTTYSEYRFIKPDGEVRWLAAHSTLQDFAGQKCSLTISRDITEQKRSSEEKELLYKLISNSSEGIGIFDIDKGKYIFINKAIEEITGYSAESFYENPSIFYDICHESDRESRKKYAKEKIWPPISKFRIIRKDGKIRICEDKIQKDKILDKNCALFILRDITEKEKVAEITTLFELTINAMTDGFSLRDLHTNQYMYMNPSIEKITGYPVKQFYEGGLEFWINNVVYKNDQHKMLPYIKTKKWPERFEYRIVKPDGKIHWIEAILSQTKYQDKLCVATINRDITDKKHSEEIHNLLDIHLAATSTAVVIRNDERVIYANQGLADLHGYPLEKLKKGYFDFRINTCVHPDDREMEKNLKEDLGNEKIWPTIRKERIIKPDGTIHWIRATISPLKYFGEKCYALFIKDITKEKEDAELKQIIADAELMSEELIIIGVEKLNYLYLNKSRERIYGYPLDAFYKNGCSFWFDTCLHPEDRDKELEFLDKKSWPQKRRFRIVRPNGEIRHLEVKKSHYSIITYKGQECRVIVEIDVTDKVNDENEILRLKKELEKMKKERQ